MPTATDALRQWRAHQQRLMEEQCLYERGRYMGMQGLGALGGLLGQQQERNSSFYTDTRVATTSAEVRFEKRNKTIKEELQSEVDEWLKDVI